MITKIKRAFLFSFAPLVLYQLQSGMKKVLIKDIKGLVLVEDEPKMSLSGSEMADYTILEDAWLAIEGEHIVDFGLMEDLQGITDWNNLEIIDAEGKYVLPSWCDSHTHLVFAKSRENEFEYRIKGMSYEEIAAKGGGIWNSALALRETSENELFDSALERLNHLVSLGTGAVEIKSGYGLDFESELKILRVIKRLKAHSKVEIKATLLAAHAFPPEFKDNHQGYIQMIVEELLPAVAAEKLADYFDVFCERNYFSAEETNQLLKAATNFGLRPKIHVNQFSSMGGIEVAIHNNALSVDHLEVLSDDEINQLKNSTTFPVSLPSCSFFLQIPYTPARKIVDANLPLVLASDFNPGSTPSGNMSFVVSLACIQQKLLPKEAIAAATINGAAALELSNMLGSIARGKYANLIVTQKMPSLAFLPYSFGTNLIDSVFLKGELVQKTKND